VPFRIACTVLLPKRQPFEVTAIEARSPMR
jgi:hypothetical protein